MSPSSGLRLERLDAHHDLAGFDSGNEDLNGWLRRHALAAQQMDSARTFVATRAGHVVGYFSLTMGSVLRQDAASQARAGSAGLPGRDGAPRPAGSRSQRAGPRFRSKAARRSPSQGRRRWRSSSSASRSRRRRRRTSRPILRTSWLRSGARSRAAVLPEDEGHREKPRGAGMTVPWTDVMGWIARAAR